mmetsp:Transcript_4225/g.5975  ORF Transcript_4225/g.5975 Transcript_4225/m.5975 type:complete len:96 (-) Transcript_4225:158-445(-)
MDIAILSTTDQGSDEEEESSETISIASETPREESGQSPMDSIPTTPNHNSDEEDDQSSLTASEAPREVEMVRTISDVGSLSLVSRSVAVLKSLFA